MDKAKLNRPGSTQIWSASLSASELTVEVSSIDFAKGPSSLRSESRRFESLDAARAFVNGAVMALEWAGWRLEGTSAPEAPSVGAIPTSFRPRGQLRRRLSDETLRAHSGRVSPQTALRVGLAFDHPEVAAAQLRDYPHLDDWLVRNPWPEGLTPFAWLSPRDSDDEDLCVAANPSDLEEFFAADVEDRRCPVYYWTVDAGFERVADSLEAFLVSLEA